MIDKRTTRHPGYQISPRKRKRIEEIFGWMKTVGGMRKLRYRGLELAGWMFTLSAAANKLVRIRNLAIVAGKGSDGGEMCPAGTNGTCEAIRAFYDTLE